MGESCRISGRSKCAEEELCMGVRETIFVRLRRSCRDRTAESVYFAAQRLIDPGGKNDPESGA